MIKFPMINRPRTVIPDDAKLVYDSGSILKTYEYEQAQFDGTARKYALGWLRDSAFCIPVKNERSVIMLEQEQAGAAAPFYGLPGGFVDDGEEHEGAAKRELVEETGHKSDTLIHFIEHNKSDKIANTESIFIAYDCERVGAQKLDAAEKIKAFEISIREFICDMLVHPDFREKWIMQYLALRFSRKKLINILKENKFTKQR
ncbi:MAG: NUDIX hydrolase [Alphaproteobacteria bacterium]|nr:NUDIX hydrolase [Alphaproteobacteria bacterium]